MLSLQSFKLQVLMRLECKLTHLLKMLAHRWLLHPLLHGALTRNRMAFTGTNSKCIWTNLPQIQDRRTTTTTMEGRRQSTMMTQMITETTWMGPIWVYQISMAVTMGLCTMTLNTSVIKLETICSQVIDRIDSRPSITKFLQSLVASSQTNLFHLG